MSFPSRIISGGQTGADRAGLDFAIAQAIAHGGWCPKGRRSEDGRVPDQYQLQETPSSGYPPRTLKNVQEADATVIFTPKGHFSPGSKLTARFAREQNKPHLVLSAFPDVGADAAALEKFLGTHQVDTLNVAGSREQSVPGLHDHVVAVLETVRPRLKP